MSGKRGYEMDWKANPYKHSGEYRAMGAWFESLVPEYSVESYPWCRDLASGSVQSCCRFYSVFPYYLPLVRATLCLSADTARLEVVRWAVTPCEWASEWTQLLGERAVPVSKARAFLQEFEKRDIWQLQGRTDVTGGDVYCLVVAKDGVDHCVVMCAPNSPSDPIWQELINSFSGTFLEGAFSWDFERKLPGENSVYRHPAISGLYRF